MRKHYTLMKAAVYISFLIFFLAGTVLRRAEVEKQREEVPVSYITEIKEHGKPVTVITAEPGTFETMERFTVVPAEKNRFEGYVTPGTARILREGQPSALVCDDGGLPCVITCLSPDPDLGSGLYRVEMEIEGPGASPGARFAAQVKTGEAEGVLEVPDEALEIEEGGFYLWKLIDGKSYRQKVEVSERSGHTSVISSGLAPGDVVVVTGRSVLKDGDRVRIIGDKGAARRE